MFRRITGLAIAGYVLTSLAVLSLVMTAAVYIASPYLLSRYLASYLQTQGVELSEFVVGRPGFKHLTIARATVISDGVAVDANDVVLRYHLAGLREQRIDEVLIQRLSITLPASSSEPGAGTLPLPWTEIPVDNLTIADFELRSAAPVMNLAGRVSMSPMVAAARLTVASDLLPAALDIALQLQPSGDLMLEIGTVESAPVLMVRGQYDDSGQIKFDGDLRLEGAAFQLALALAGVEAPAGFVKGAFTGSGTWPLAGIETFTGTGQFDVDVKGNVVGADGLSYRGMVEIVVGPNGLQVAANASSIGIEALTFQGSQYLYKDTLVGLSYRTQIPLTGGVPDLSLITGEAEMNLAINLPGATRASDALTLHGTRVNGNLALNLGNQLPQLSGKLLAAVSHFDYENTRFQVVGDPIEVVIDLKSARDALNDVLTPPTGTLWANVVTTMTSNANDEPLSKFGLDAGIEIKLEQDRYLVSISPNSFVNLLAGGQDFSVETRNSILVEVGPDGTLSSLDARLSSRFEFDADGQLLKYPDARIIVESLAVTGDKIEARGQFTSDRSSHAMPVNFQVNANLASAAGTFQLSTNHVIGRHFLKKELPGWVADYELSGGQIKFGLTGSFDVSDEPRFDASGEVDLAQGIARYDDVPLTGVSARLPVRLDNNNVFLGPGQVRIESADVGFPVQSIAFQLEADAGLARLNQLSATLLMADIRIDEMVYDINKESARFGVQVSGLPVANVLALEGDDIQGNGILDGRLPVVINSAGTSVAGGKLIARPPGGYLRYLGDLPATNPGLELAIRALRNFQYSEMDVGVDYAPDGALAALIKLRGKSPDVENGRAIHFNMNVSENIPSLLESIRASEAAQNRIQQRLSR